MLIAPQALKGTLGPRAVARHLARGVGAALPEAMLVELPVADGGDGLLEAVLPPGARREQVAVTGPLGEPVEAEVGWLDPQTAVVECASACGLRLIPPARRDPMRATSRGLGELLAFAARRDARRLYVGLGGTATTDGGTGMARALGWSFRDARGGLLPEGGGALQALASATPAPVPATEIVGLADVYNPLLGPEGAARTFAPQKGADPAQVAALERALARLAQWGAEMGWGAVADLPGAGAAGGLGAGLCWFAGGRLEGGADWVLDRVGFDRALVEADLVLTAEGVFDRTSLGGKATGEVLRRAGAAGVPAAVIAGRGETVNEFRLFTGGSGTLAGDDLAGLAAEATRVLLGLPRS